MDRNDTGIPLPPGAVAPPSEVTEEEMFSSVFNENVVRRFMRFISPYKFMVTASMASVLIFTGSQLSIPIIIQKTLDQEFTVWGEGVHSLMAGVSLFFLWSASISFPTSPWSSSSPESLSVYSSI